MWDKNTPKTPLLTSSNSIGDGDDSVGFGFPLPFSLLPGDSFGPPGTPLNVPMDSKPELLGIQARAKDSPTYSVTFWVWPRRDTNRVIKPFVVLARTNEAGHHVIELTSKELSELQK